MELLGILAMCDQLLGRKGVQNSSRIRLFRAENLYVIILSDELLLGLCEVLRRGGRHHRREVVSPLGSAARLATPSP